MALNGPLLRTSFEIVVEREPNPTSRFYDILFARYPDAQKLFGRNTRQKQEKMLTDALVAVIDHLDDAPWLTETLGAMGKKHVDYGVKDEMYAWVGECLLATLAEIGREDWTPEVGAAWRDAYGAISGLMLAGARG